MKQVLENLVKTAVSDVFGAEIAMGVLFVVAAPTKPGMGDYATNVAMVIAKKLGKNPKEVAHALVQSSNFKVQSIERIEIAGAFINFYLNAGPWFKQVMAEVQEAGDRYGYSVQAKPEKVMVEYLSPNTNKPLHLGHLRNGVTGAAVINLLKAAGHDVMKAEIINDRGVHICKAMLAYQRWGGGATPESVGKKPDHFIGEWYVRFAKEAEVNPELNDEAQEMLRKWEAGDPEIRKLWLTVRQWVLEGWKQTENLLGFTFDKIYFESDVYGLGKEIIDQGLQKGIFRKNDKGNIVFDLDPDQFGRDEEGNPRLITVLRADGTGLYYTQDLGLQTSRVAEFHLDRIIHVVGSEQNFYFKALFAIFKALGYAWADKLYHLSYAMVYLPEGKMKSREGTVVDTDDLVAQVMDLAKQEIESRNKDPKSAVTPDEQERRSRVIALSAIKFYLLKQKPVTDIYFNSEESISFEGFTGPYCQYTYARAQSILRSSAAQGVEVDYSVLGNEDERNLIRLIESYSDVIQHAAVNYDPAHVATYVFKLAQSFNQFYSSSPVLKAEGSLLQARLALVESTAVVIKNGLHILGIETLEEM